MRKVVHVVGLVAAGLLASGIQTGAETVTLSGAGQTEDTYLRGDDTVMSAPSNYGNSSYLIVGDLAAPSSDVSINGLMRFADLSSLSGQRVTNATLRLLNANHVNQKGDVSIEIHELVAANGDWVAGTGNNEVQAGSSCWRFKHQNKGAWAGGRNGAGVAGVDYTTHLVGSTVASNTTQEWVEFALDPSVVQRWIDNANRNYGIVLTAPGAVDGEAAFFRSSDAGTNIAPQLVLEVTPKPDEPTEMLYFAGTNQLEDVYLRGKDSEISTTYNYGSSALLIAGQLNQDVVVNTLMRAMDLSGLSGRTVTNATLRLFNSNHANQTGDVSIEIHELVPENGDWVEGTTNSATQFGSSNWRFKIMNTGTWAGGQNGAGVAGIDYASNLVASATAVDEVAEWVEFTLDASVVQNWIDNPTQNYGLVLTSPTASSGQIAFFYSSEAGIYIGPQLMVEVLPEKTYAKWAEENNLTGADALRTTDVEPDGMDNLLEYALGGNPKIADADAVLPSSSIVEDSGANWLEYIYSRRLDASARGLDYAITLNTNDLVLGAWINIGTDAETGTAAIDSEFESVTNRFSTGEDKKFTSLEITEE